MIDADRSVEPTQDEPSRTLVLVVYGLYLIAIVSVGTAGIAGIAGVVLAYIKRGGTASGSVWHGHYTNQIQSFWIWFGLMVLGAMTFWMAGVGFVVMGVALIYFMYRTLKGLVRALENKAYEIER